MLINDDKTGSSQPSRESYADRTGTNPFRSPAHSYTASPSSDYTLSVTSQYTPTHAPDSHAPNRSSQSLVQGHGDSSPPEYFPRGSGDSSFGYSDKSVHYSAALAGMATFQDNGRLQITSDEKLPKSLPDSYCTTVDEIGIDVKEFANAPPMNICIMIVGSRGDVQPYLALGQKLQRHGHTVRLATHEAFRKLVRDTGLRFYNIGGDPHELMSYMVRNPGLIPGFESVMKGDIGKKQKMIGEMLEWSWKSCNEPDNDSEGGAPFAAGAIISNPPAFAHIHCAEALGIPLLLSFSMQSALLKLINPPLVQEGYLRQNWVFRAETSCAEVALPIRRALDTLDCKNWNS